MPTYGSIRNTLYPQEEVQEQVSCWHRCFWFMLEVVYLGGIAFNMYLQTEDSWKRYVFELSIVGAWFVVIQHTFWHPHSPVAVKFCRSHDGWTHCKCCLPQRLHEPADRCLSEPHYTGAVGFSNLTLILEILIAVMYWALGSPIGATQASGLNGLNAIIIHGVLPLGQILDCSINQRPYCMKRALMNVTFFLACVYAPWHLFGRTILGEPVYPHVTLLRHFTELLIALGIALATGIIIAIGIWGITKINPCKRSPPTVVIDDSVLAPSANYRLVPHYASPTVHVTTVRV